MSLLDKIVATVAPPESAQTRKEATDKARSLADAGSWLELALDHHDRIRAAFKEVKAGQTAKGRTDALKALALVLNGHAQAEETILYPALALAGHKMHAEMGYNEQALVKIQMAALGQLPPTSQEFDDKLDHIEGAVLHHMYKEESGWFLHLREEARDQPFLTQRFAEEFTRYAGA
jgi:iron-sulfur cluster repair protein YtfE (RIC family)